MDQTSVSHYLPIITTLLSFAFASIVHRRYRQRGGTHLLWWSFGILVYGLGTLAESWITLFGWNIVVFKFWYIVGALMGGAPLAQGTVWLLMKRPVARATTVALVAVVTVAAACVLASPVDRAAIDPRLPSGAALGWQWVRAFSPFINTYAVIFLVGGAIVSARRFYLTWRARGGGEDVARDRFLGNALIAAGAILPGLGGAASRMGHTEWLYVGELAGILLIWPGYWLNVRARPAMRSRAAAVAASLIVMAIAPGGSALASQVTSDFVVVVSAPDGRPAADVGIALGTGSDAPSVRRTRTDPSGRAVFVDVPSGEWVVSISMSGFRPVELPVHVGAGRPGTVGIRLVYSCQPSRSA